MSATARSARPAHRRTVDGRSRPARTAPRLRPGHRAAPRRRARRRRDRRRARPAFARVRALPDSRWLDRALRGRAVDLAARRRAARRGRGMQVSLLKLNSGIGARGGDDGDAGAPERRARGVDRAPVGPTASRPAPAGLGMLMPPRRATSATSRARRGDAKRAVQRMEPPSAEAQALLANDGIVPGSLVAAPDDRADDGHAPTPATTTTTARPRSTPPRPRPIAADGGHGRRHPTTTAAPATDVAVPVAVACWSSAASGSSSPSSSSCCCSPAAARAGSASSRPTR